LLEVSVIANIQELHKTENCKYCKNHNNYWLENLKST